MYGILATLLVAFHFAFILFVMFGGLLVIRWPRAAWVHLPLAAWGAYVEFSGRVCPLTPLENRFRQLAGESGYTSGFIDQYLVRLVYPPGLTRDMQIALGVGVVLLNVGVYAWALRRRRAGEVETSGVQSSETESS